MGYRAVEWAFSLKLTPTMSAVLVALSHRADDKTFEAFPGQQAVAGMTGMSIRTVTRALSDLESLGVIRREQRRRTNGYKSSDLCILNVDSYQSESQVTESHATPGQVTENPISPDSDDSLTGLSVRYIEDEKPEDQSGEKSDFDEFWDVYPRREGKADALKAYKAARRKTSASEILAGARAYALLRTGEDVSFTKLAGGWLRAGRWDADDASSHGSHHAADADGNSRVSTMITPHAMCPLHPGYPDTDRFPCEACMREAELPEGASF